MRAAHHSALQLGSWPAARQWAQKREGAAKGLVFADAREEG